MKNFVHRYEALASYRHTISSDFETTNETNHNHRRLGKGCGKVRSKPSDLTLTTYNLSRVLYVNLTSWHMKLLNVFAQSYILLVWNTQGLRFWLSYWNTVNLRNVKIYYYVQNACCRSLQVVRREKIMGGMLLSTWRPQLLLKNMFRKCKYSFMLWQQHCCCCWWCHRVNHRFF